MIRLQINMHGLKVETGCYCEHDYWVDNLNLAPTEITSVVQQTSKQKI